MKSTVYQPGVFEPGLVTNLFIDGKKEDVKSKFVTCLFPF